MDTKKIWQSKTFWANALAIIIGIAMYFGIQPDQATTQKTGEVITLLLPVINIILRFITKKPIE